MRAAPACQVSLVRSWVWRIDVLALPVLGAALIALSQVLRDPPIGIPLPTAMLAAALDRLLARTAQTHLRRDFLSGRLGPAPADPIPGEPVAIDLEACILPRFMPAARGSRTRRANWLPALRRGLAARFPLLRCVPYPPRLATSEEAGA